MSVDGKRVENEVQDAMERLLAGREPKAAWLARCPTLKAWSLDRTIDARGRRRIVVHGTLASGRFTVKDQPRMPATVLWMDRHLRFVVTSVGLWTLGESEEEVGLDLKLSDEGEGADD
jgi:hypothetical protein